MLACKGVFAKPSITQPRKCAEGQRPKNCNCNSFCVYYITLSAKYQVKIKIYFRDKIYGYKYSNLSIYDSNDLQKPSYKNGVESDPYLRAFFSNICDRPSCYTCKFAKMDREADISIADFWGGKDAECYSLIVCNSSKGASLLKNQTAGKLEEVDKETVHQPHMKAPCDMPKERNQFWNVYLNDGYDAVQTKFGNNTPKGKIKYCIADMLQSLHLAGIVKKLKNR